MDDSSDATEAGAPSGAPPPGKQPYQVLARKYRPATFADLIGQEAMVRTLRNAFETDRIAHAFVLTGVRGVGKTTTARIIAKALNCVGPDGKGGPTVTPCGVCAHCVAIAESRHVDVLELDAATNTQVDKMRELLAGVPYRPADARCKVYVIDEVHMLSNSSFNALLKTLEEPPEHVKFIFATTEIRKVPVTVLSRCQRFDLRRIEPETLVSHLARVAAMEGAEVGADALALIARAAEGSVRDALSLLDRAIADGGAAAGAAEVREMLGLADRGRVLDLFERIMAGDCAGALAEIGDQHVAGADPLSVLRDLAEVTHWISVVKISPEALEDPTVAPEERRRGGELAERLTMRPLTRMWQMLLKAMEEVEAAPSAMMAAEMAVIRLTHVAELPSPDDLVRRLGDGGAAPGQGAGQGAPAAPSRPPGGGARARAGGGAAPMRAERPQVTLAAELPRAETVASPDADDALARFQGFADVVALIRAKRDAKLLVEVETGVRLVSYHPGRIAFAAAAGAPASLASDLAARLRGWTGARWLVSVEGDSDAETIAERRAAEDADLEATLREHPLVRAAFEAFPGAELRAVRGQAADDAASGEPDSAPIEIDLDPDEWDDWEPVDPFVDE